MVDPNPRPDRYGDKGPDLDSVNGLIQARIDGAISRRQLMRRAAALAIAAPVVNVMLHATSDMAHGAPSQGRERALARMRAQGAAHRAGRRSDCARGHAARRRHPHRRHERRAGYAEPLPHANW